MNSFGENGSKGRFGGKMAIYMTHSGHGLAKTRISHQNCFGHIFETNTLLCIVKYHEGIWRNWSKCHFWDQLARLGHICDTLVPISLCEGTKIPTDPFSV